MLLHYGHRGATSGGALDASAFSGDSDPHPHCRRYRRSHSDRLLRCWRCCRTRPWEVKAALGRSLTFTEDIWFRYTARMPDYLLFYHNIIFLFIIFYLTPLPLALIELGFPASVSSFKIQPKICLPLTSFFQCYMDVMWVFLLVVGPLQLTSYPHHQGPFLIP
ncbi:hypothetical protein ZIOFF_073203 [Zingiber officinale]|uniref:Uncharacterized protein n=1 Tax=Zingiber officinale TaxID=94328 RepID=A0A8J5C728_ZINOF|nr:hypothetical protein ZIOFF_073203 [Zingiber officinale]